MGYPVGMTYAFAGARCRAALPWLIGGAWLLGCNVDTAGSGPELTVHCGFENGDTTCSTQYTGRPFCNTCVDKDDHQGCVASQPPPACSPSATSFDDSGGELESDGGSSSSSGGDPDTTTTGSAIDTTDASVDSTGPEVVCEEEGLLDEDCEALDPGRAYCIGAACVGCAEVGGDPFCLSVDSLRPACDLGTGICNGCESGGEAFCSGTTPVCDGTGACMPCANHGECPTTACHLAADDPLRGACFAPEELLYVDGAAICPGNGTMGAPSCSLAAAVGTLAPGDSAVVRLTAGAVYDEHVVVPADVTVAILGAGGVPEIVGLPGLDDGSISVLGGTLYLQGVRIAGNTASHGIVCSGGAVWLDQSEVRTNEDYGIYVTAPCGVTVRRASVHHNGGGGIRQFGGALLLENAVIGRNGDGEHGPAVNLQFADATVLYSTIAGNDGVGHDSIQCLDATGRVRNSIITGMANQSVDLDCFEFDFVTNAIDTLSFAGADSNVVGAYQVGWFDEPENGDFRLLNPVFTPFGDVALWTDGDPSLDADGTIRPFGGELGYAGVDEP